MKLMIEVKERTRVSEVCRELSALYRAKPWMYERCFVASFNPMVLYQLRRLEPNVVTSFLFINECTGHLIKGARDLKISIPAWFEFNYPVRWLIDDLIWNLGTTRIGLNLLGVNLSACEVKALTENQIRNDRMNGIITSTWVANNEQQKEWLLQMGVTVITDVQFSGGSCSVSPRPQTPFN